MFDNLVESTSAKGEGTKKSAFFGTTALVLASLALALFVWSLYSVSLNLGEEDLALNSLVAPVPVPEAEPPPPETPDKPEQKTAQEDAPKNFDVRTVLQQDMDSTPKVPDTTSVTQNQNKSTRDVARTVIGNRDLDASGGAPTGPAREPGGGGGGIPIQQKPVVPDDADEPPPAATPKPSPTPPKVPAVVSGGVVNGKASNLVKPTYPPAAKAVRASGTVTVQVLIDENGNVVSASAASGHPLLRAAAVSAARSSKFSPTLLSGQKVKVTGIISYNFVAP